MARNRMIKPEFWEDDKLSECSTNARLLFIALWNFADDEGFLEHRAKWLKAKCFPYDDLDIDSLIFELLRVGVIESQNEILHVKKFLKHQKIDHPKSSGLKAKFEDSTNIRRTLDEDSTTKYKLKEYKLKEYKLKEDKLSERESVKGKKENLSAQAPTPEQMTFSFWDSVETKNDSYWDFVNKVGESRNLEKEKIGSELDRFVNYWREKTRDGKKERWQTEKVFEVQRRFVVWLSRMKEAPAPIGGIRIIS